VPGSCRSRSSAPGSPARRSRSASAASSSTRRASACAACAAVTFAFRCVHDRGRGPDVTRAAACERLPNGTLFLEQLAARGVVIDLGPQQLATPKLLAALARHSALPRAAIHRR